MLYFSKLAMAVLAVCSFAAFADDVPHKSSMLESMWEGQAPVFGKFSPQPVSLALHFLFHGKEKKKKQTESGVSCAVASALAYD